MVVVLKGLGTSPGKVSGCVKVVHSDADYVDFDDGDVLVTKITDPSMTIIINKCSAIICDIGGLTSHPSIIAREMGIPAVVGTKNATEILTDGQQVIVDGSTGEVLSDE